MTWPSRRSGAGQDLVLHSSLQGRLAQPRAGAERLRSPVHGRHGTSAGVDFGDHTGGDGDPDDMVAAVVLAGNAVEGLHVDRVGSVDG